MSQNIANYLIKLDKPMHKTLDFVNTPISKDVRLFIDPVLIEIGDSKFCEVAKKKTADFFSELHNAYYVTNKGLTFNIYKQFIQLNDKKNQITQLKNGEKT